MTRRTRTATHDLPFTERWPVVAPLAGVGVAFGGIVVAISEGDWIAASVFAIPTVLLGSVAQGNAQFLRRD
jgi:hypothetical protein